MILSALAGRCPGKQTHGAQSRKSIRHMDDSWTRKKLPHSDNLTAHPTVVSLPYSGHRNKGPPKSIP